MAEAAGETEPLAVPFTCLTAAATYFDTMEDWSRVCAEVWAPLENLRSAPKGQKVH